jgi:glycogen synthase
MEKDYSWDKSAREYLKLYYKILGKKQDRRNKKQTTSKL